MLVSLSIIPYIWIFASWRDKRAICWFMKGWVAATEADWVVRDNGDYSVVTASLWCGQPWLPLAMTTLLAPDPLSGGHWSRHRWTLPPLTTSVRPVKHRWTSVTWPFVSSRFCDGQQESVVIAPVRKGRADLKGGGVDKSRPSGRWPRRVLGTDHWAHRWRDLAPEVWHWPLASGHRVGLTSHFGRWLLRLSFV